MSDIDQNHESISAIVEADAGGEEDDVDEDQGDFDDFLALLTDKADPAVSMAEFLDVDTKEARFLLKRDLLYLAGVSLDVF